MNRPESTGALCDALDRAERVDLARETVFSIGDVRVDPARLQVVRGAVTISLEARVMQVLVVLGRAGGAVVSRDELVDRCWGGRIVADNAIQRVISRLRAVAGDLGGFTVETVTKVGYLVRPVDAAAPASGPALENPRADPGDGPPPPTGRRRVLLLGGLAALAAFGAAGLWRRGGPAQPSGDPAARLVAKGREALAQGVAGEPRQAVAYLEEATALAPGSAEAWAALALAHQRMLYASSGAAQLTHAQRAREAARRALAIAPGNLDALIALSAIHPNFRNWATNERLLLRLRSGAPPHAGIEAALGLLLFDTGRWVEATACLRRTLTLDPFHPGAQMMLAWGLWGSGMIAEADRALEAAHRRWPTDWAIWQMRFDFLVHTGRPMEAHAMVTDPRRLPVVALDQPQIPVRTLAAFALAMEGRDPADLSRVAADLPAIRPAIGTRCTSAYLAAVGRVDQAFAMVETLFLGGGGRPGPGPLASPRTSILFAAEAAPLRQHPRFPSLVERVGLRTYWRETGTRPDPRPEFPPDLLARL